MGHDPDKIISNFSNYTLSDDEKSLLTKGLNFALPAKKLKYADYLLPFELLYRDINQLNVPKDELIFLKSKIKEVGLSSYRIYNKKNHNLENLTRNEYNAYVKLCNNKDLIIQKADKGNNVVILNKCDYITSMEELLSDTSNFIPTNFAYDTNKELKHILDMEEVINKTLKKLLKDDFIT